jgi:iron(III) transport system permease protein
MAFPSSRTLVIGLAVCAFVIACLLPLIYMISASLVDRRYSALLLDPRQRELLYNSARLGVGTAALATVLGVPLGIGLARVMRHRTAVLRIVLAAPLLLPPYVVGLAWIYLGGSAGIGADLFGRDLFSSWTYSLPAAALVLALVYYPIVMLATEAALRQMDSHLEEAGLTSASPQRVLARITLPLAAPAIAGASLVVFVLAISEFSVPALLRIRVYTTEVFTAFATLYDFGRATVMTLPLLIVSAAAAAAAGILGGTHVIAGRRRSGANTALDFHAWRWGVQSLTVATIVVALLLPLGVLLREAWETPFRAVVAGSWPSIRLSLLLAVTGATLVVLVAGWLGYSRARASPRVGRVADVIFVVLFAVPSTVVGVGLIGLWNRPGALGVVYGTSAMLLLAYLARFVPVAALIVAASVRQVPISHEEASAVGGAGWLRTVVRIVMPQVTRGIAAAWVIAFVLAFGELGASILISPPGESTLPIRIYTIIANTPSSVVAALALLQVAVIFCPLAAAGWYVARRSTT